MYVPMGRMGKPCIMSLGRSAPEDTVNRTVSSQFNTTLNVPPPKKNALKPVSEGPTVCPLWGIRTKQGALTILRSSKTLCNKQANIQCLASELIFRAHKGTGKWEDNGEESTKDWNSLPYDNCGLFYLPTAHQRQQKDARAVFRSLPSSYLSS